MCAIGLGVGLGVGISQNKRTLEKSKPDLNDPPVASFKKPNLWKPEKGATWQYQLASSFETLVSGVEVYDIDLLKIQRKRLAIYRNRVKRLFAISRLEAMRTGGQIRKSLLKMI